MIHLDNTRPHLINNVVHQNGLKRFDHPPYSPDFSPSDFFLFCYLNNLLEDKNFDSDQQLITEVCLILNNIPIKILCDIFDEWIKILERYIEINGEYVE